MYLVPSSVALLFATAAIVVAVVGAAAAPDIPGHAFNRFITIWLENQDFAQVSTNPHIVALASQSISLTSYYGLTHPSQPNYLASIGGDYFGLNHDGFVEVPENVSTVVDLFDEAGVTWRGYFEGIPGPGYMGEGSTDMDGKAWDYVRKHNPFVSFDSIAHNGSRLLNILSLDDFERDLKAQRLPQYMHISPDMNSDGHNTTLDFASDWVANFLAPLLMDDYFMKDTMILLTYDESETYSKPNQITSLLLGGAVPQELRGTKDDTFYTHYSILSTLQNNWDLSNLGRFDVGANVFNFVAEKTGYVNQDLTAEQRASVDLSVSYGGFLNTVPGMLRPLTAPNQKLVGAGGKGLCRRIMDEWADATAALTPYDGSGNIWLPLEYGAQQPAG